MDNLEEKKNESLRDANDFFFVSKDVARILLADIYMYQGNYRQAEPLLAKVISGGWTLPITTRKKRSRIYITMGVEQKPYWQFGMT